jgi:hypothetical protein
LDERSALHGGGQTGIQRLAQELRKQTRSSIDIRLNPHEGGTSFSGRAFDWCDLPFLTAA